METRKALAAAEWRRHWPLVLSSALGFSMLSIAAQTIGLFMEPLQQDLRLTRSQVSIGLLITAISSIVLTPMAGAAIDRWGSRWLAIPGVAFTSATMAGFGFAGSATDWVLLWCIYALVSTGVTLPVWMTAVSKAFTSSRGLALAVVLAGATIAGILAPPLANWLIAQHGWRLAFIGLSLGWGLPTLLVTILFVRQPPIGEANALRTDPAFLASLDGLSMTEAMRSGALWRIGIATFIFMAFSSTLIVHQIPILVESGVTRATAALLASAAAVAALCGKILTGWLMDRFHAARLSGVVIALCSISFVLLVEPLRSTSSIILGILLIGFTGGAKLNVTTYLTGRYGGLRNFGKLCGVMGSIIAVGGSVGPLAAAAVYDHAGSYSAFLIAGIPAGLLSGWLVFGLGPYPTWKAQQVAFDPHAKPVAA